MPTKYISADNKNYTFIPGKEGSLTAPAPKKSNQIYTPRPSVAKTICKDCGKAYKGSVCPTCSSTYASALSSRRSAVK